MGGECLSLESRAVCGPRCTARVVICEDWRPRQTLPGTLPPSRSHRLSGPSPLIRHQVRHSHQVVGRSHKVPSQPRPLNSPVTCPPESSHSIHPPEHLLHPLAYLLARPVAGVPCGASVYCRVCPLRHVRRHPPLRMALTHSRVSYPLSALPASWDGSPAASRRPASQAQPPAPPYPWPCSPRSPSAVRCRSPHIGTPFVPSFVFWMRSPRMLLAAGPSLCVRRLIVQLSSASCRLIEWYS